jgi:methyltransferase (TIGR00027 family)
VRGSGNMRWLASDVTDDGKSAMSREDGSPGGVGETAIGAAMMRARESSRPDRLFDDPFAAALVEAAAPVFDDGPSSADDPSLAQLEAAFEVSVAVRTRFYDDFALAATAAGCRQVVLLGAGLDTRAFRLQWPTGLRLFELDLPEVLAFKERVLSQMRAEPRCMRSAVAVDLREDWPVALLGAGFKPTARSAWIAEGLVPYLADDDAQRLLVAIGSLSSRGSQLGLDQATIQDDSLLAQARAMPAMEEIASMWRGGLSGNAVGWLRRQGWQVETFNSASLRERYGRHTKRDPDDGFLAATRLA